jgi:quercetin dioxygenase-like cupin family protein
MKLVKQGQGTRLNVLGDAAIIKLSGEDTGGGYAVWETISGPGMGPPMHRHTREDESFYILEGEHEFSVDGERIKAGPGTFVYAPRGTKHTFRNLSSRPGRMLVTVQPAGLEKFFAELDALPPGPPDMARILPIFEKYGLEFIGPPLSAG